MKKGYVGLLACASGILIGLGISRLDLTGYLEKTQEQEYHCLLYTSLSQVSGVTVQTVRTS